MRLAELVAVLSLGTDLGLGQPMEHWLAVVVSTAAAFLIGLAWFSPPAFGNFWAGQVSRYTSRGEAEIAGDASRATALAGWLGSIAVTAVVMAMVVEAVNADSAGEGAVLGLVLALGLAATLASWPLIFARMPWQCGSSTPARSSSCRRQWARSSPLGRDGLAPPYPVPRPHRAGRGAH